MIKSEDAAFRVLCLLYLYARRLDIKARPPMLSICVKARAVDGR